MGKNKRPRIKRGKIQVIEGNKIRVVTDAYNEEAVDFFTFDEILEFIRKEESK